MYTLVIPGHVSVVHPFTSFLLSGWLIWPDHCIPPCLSLLPIMSLSSNAPNSLPWLAEDNSLEWQEQVMVYLQRKQLAQYVQGWTRYLPPDPPMPLTTLHS